MKKAIFLLALAVLLICLMACNDHEHTFSDSEWANDTAYHWVGCTVEGCTEASERFEHAFGNPDDGSFDLEEGGEEDEGYRDQEKVEEETFPFDGLQTEVVEAN